MDSRRHRSGAHHPQGLRSGGQLLRHLQRLRSQANFGKAFRQLCLVPGQCGYDEGRRRSIFLTSKTGLRWAKGQGSAHHSPPVMMEMIQRDERGVLEGMPVAINANDRLQFNIEHNVIPVARARDMALIGMKTFADGALYTKPASWSSQPEHVVRTVGIPGLPSRPLIEYSLSTPGIQTQPKSEVTPPRDAGAQQEMKDGRRVARLQWQTAYAGDEPIVSYEIWRDQKKVAAVPHKPQTSKQPFLFEEAIQDKSAHVYQVKTLDAGGRSAATADLLLSNIA